MRVSIADARRELERIQSAGLLSPQERALLERIVNRTLDGEGGLLYQKALAEDLGISSAKQIGVLATRLRSKLSAHYREAHALPAVQIELPERGYQARFSYREALFTLSERAQILVANAKAAIDQRSLDGAGAALGFLKSALDCDPNHPLLLSLQAYCHATRALYGTYPRTDLEIAARLVERTRTADPRPWESWFADACVKMALQWDWAGAEADFGQAIAASGRDAEHQPWYTAFLASQGQADHAVALLRASVTRVHDSPIVRADLAAASIYAGRYEEAAETISTALALFGPRAHYLLHVHLAILQEARGEAAAALATIQQVPLKWPRTAITLGLRALFSGLSGDRFSARRHFLKLRAARAVTGRYIPAGQLAIAALGAGDHGAAVEWLRTGAMTERDPNLVLSNVYPFFRHLHHDQGFRTLVTETMRLRLSNDSTAPSPSTTR